MKSLMIIGFVLLMLGTLKRDSRPLGIRLNNPGNIKHDSRNDWLGMSEDQPNSTFVRFDSPEYGFRAMARIFRSYNRRGINTIRGIVSTYAPAFENKTEEYIRYVSEQLNTSPDKPLELEEQLLTLIKTITTYEQGASFANHYPDSTIEKGISLA